MSNVFCNIPWVEVHINADGTYHTCGAQTNRISGTEEAKLYNVHNMTIPAWINSKHQRRARINKLNNIPESACAMCYHEESLGSSSKRVKENLKSGITENNFELTFIHSKDYPLFDYSARNKGLTDFDRPTSYHLSLGNECNLACKMCGPTASSRLAVQMIKEGTYSGPARMNWTEDETAWNHVVDYICTTENLKFVHLIGGEPLMNPRFEQLIDRLLAAKKTDIYLGFTTNGTMFNHNLMTKLSAFRHVDVGVSIECWGELNDLVRQGSTTQTVLDNIDQYLKYRRQAHIYVTLRAVPSALTVHTLDELYKWCITRELDVVTNILVEPEYQQISQLPKEIKERLIARYELWQHSEPAPADSNPRDPTWFKQHIDNEIMAIIMALKQEPEHNLTDELYDKLELWGWFDHPEVKKYFFICD
jgi:MoaA/NifB/PqqE/SkfB family radical SAM enzyme